MKLSVSAGASSAALVAERDPGDERQSLEALAQAMLLHPYAVQLLMSKYEPGPALPCPALFFVIIICEQFKTCMAISQGIVEEYDSLRFLHVRSADVFPLLHRLQEKGVGTDQEWHSILSKPLFARAADETSASLAHLSEIFVERHHLVWKVAALSRNLGNCVLLDWWMALVTEMGFLAPLGAREIAGRMRGLDAVQHQKLLEVQRQ